MAGKSLDDENQFKNCQLHLVQTYKHFEKKID